jgi:hypothetical protein
MKKEREKGTKSIIALVCVGMLCAVAMPTIIGIIEQDDFLALDIVTQTTTLGDNVSYLVTIKNLGSETGTYTLIAINIDNASVASLSQTTITLDTGQSGDVLLNVTDELIPGPYCVLVNATSQTTALTGEVETITAVVEEWDV